MAIPYTIRIGNGQLAANANTSNFRPPAGYVWILTNFQTWIATPTAANYCQVLVVSTNTKIIELGRSTTTQYWTWSGRAYLPQSDSIYVQAIGSVAHWYLTAYQLTIT